MKRILVVDDDADLREMLGFALEDEFDVVLAANGFEALRRLDNEPFDAVVLDLSMPELDGRGVIREMRKRRLAVPIVVVSAEVGLARIAAQLAVAEFLAKPVGLGELRQTLVRMTGGSRKVRAQSETADIEA